MLILILLLVAGSIVVYIAQYNFMPVTVNLGLYVFSDIPLFYVITGSLLAGLVLSYLVYLIYAISNSLKLRGKNIELKKKKNEVMELTKRIHQLELQNEKLSHNSGNKPEDPDAL